MTQKDIILEACRRIVDGTWPQPAPFEVMEYSYGVDAKDYRLIIHEFRVAATHRSETLPTFMHILGLPEPLVWVDYSLGYQAFLNDLINFIIINKNDAFHLFTGTLIPYPKGNRFDTLESAQEAAYWWLVELIKPKKV